MTWTVEQRRAWAFPPMEGIRDGIDLALLDPVDPDDRGLLIRFEHPHFEEALAAGLDEIVVDGTTINPHLHLAIHEVVANQLWDEDPPEVAETAHRLDLAGYERHEVFHMIGSVMSEEIWQSMRHHQTFDLERIVRELTGLPESWETQRGEQARK